jgi:hypothetical protein
MKKLILSVYTGNDGSQYLHTLTGLFTRKSIITLSSNKQKEVGWAELDFQGKSTRSAPHDS